LNTRSKARRFASERLEAEPEAPTKVVGVVVVVVVVAQKAKEPPFSIPPRFSRIRFFLSRRRWKKTS
jgi:hypothetical protein